MTAEIKSGSGTLTTGIAPTLNISVTAVMTDCSGTGTDLLTYPASQNAPDGSTALAGPTDDR